MEEIENNKDTKNKKEIMKAAKELFIKYGLNKTTIDEIAETARKSKTTIYQLFSNKENILVEILNDEARAHFDCVVSEVNKQTSSINELKAYIKTTICEFKKKFLLFSLVKGEIKTSLLSHYQVRKEIDMFEKEVVKNIIFNGIKTGEFSEYYEPKLDYIAYYITNFTRGLMMQLILDEENNLHIDDDDNFNVFTDILIKGLEK
ncbi:MAG: TetR/AcrR family transcriptional regulator [Candidatus Delongbacteria bacterium]